MSSSLFTYHANQPSIPCEGPEPYCVNIAGGLFERTYRLEIEWKYRISQKAILFHRYRIRIDSAHSLYRVFASSSRGQVFSLYHQMHVLTIAFLRCFCILLWIISCGVCSFRNNFCPGMWLKLKICQNQYIFKKEKVSLTTKNKSKITKAIRKNNEYQNKQHIAIINQL
jgi:hypothetical protein